MDWAIKISIFTGVLTALFTGAIAFKSYANKKPLLFCNITNDTFYIDKKYVHKQKLKYKIYNLNEFSIFIEYIINLSTQDDILLIDNIERPDLYNKLPLYTKLELNNIYGHGLTEKNLLVSSDFSSIKLQLYRANFNFFSEAPKFQLVIRPSNFYFWYEKLCNIFIPLWETMFRFNITFEYNYILLVKSKILKPLKNLLKKILKI
jgi:hypothetical protein